MILDQSSSTAPALAILLVPRSHLAACAAKIAVVLAIKRQLNKLDVTGTICEIVFLGRVNYYTGFHGPVFPVEKMTNIMYCPQDAIFF